MDDIGVMSITGLADLRRTLRALDRRAVREFDKTLRLAVHPIVADARSRYYAPTGRYQRRTGRTPRFGIRATTRGGAPAVTLGGRKYSYAIGQEWGSRTSKQFGLPRGSIYGEGTFLWPAIVAGREQLAIDIEKQMRVAVAAAEQGLPS